MSSYKTAQRRFRYRGREFHFVSYEGHRADPARAIAATPPTWFLMSAGKRWAVGPQEPGQTAADLDQQLSRWLNENIFVPVSDGESASVDATGPAIGAVPGVRGPTAVPECIGGAPATPRARKRTARGAA
jgi:hypothetical protein